jgi:ferredoxin
MIRLTIDNKAVEVSEGATVLEAARALGIAIPALCFREGGEPSTSCMACVVKVAGRAGLVPSCTARVHDGMVVESETAEVLEARRAAIELLLADHLGDCEAPCQAICPAGLRIPKLARALRDGRSRDAAALARQDLVLPATLGRICPAPCEKGCRRASHDAAVSIRHLHRAAADQDLGSGQAYLPARGPSSGRRVAVIGAGPAGLAAAWALLQRGHACTIFDDHDRPGGMLRYGVQEDALPRDVLDAEIALVERLGAEFRLGVRVGRDLSVDDLRRDFQAVVAAVGPVEAGDAARLGLAASKTGLQVVRATGAAPVAGVFVCGDAVRKSRMAVRSVGDAKAVAESVDQYLLGRPVVGAGRRFSVHIGQVAPDEMALFLKEASDAGRAPEPVGGAGVTLTVAEAAAEAARCLHCDCRKPESCRLRAYAEIFQAKASRYKGQERRRFVQDRAAGIVYEPGKCIDCGICIRVAEEAREPLGLTFIGRGFNVRVGVPFDRGLQEGLRTCAAACAAACPTGALALADAEE